MPLTTLELKFDLENIAKVYVDPNEYEWKIKIKCTHCGEEAPQPVSVVASEQYDVPNSKGKTNFNYKCKNCKRSGRIDVVTSSYKPYTEEDNGQFKTCISFECRGLDITGWEMAPGFKAEASESGTEFEVDEIDWNDYDEEGKQSVGIYEMKYRLK